MTGVETHIERMTERLQHTHLSLVAHRMAYQLAKNDVAGLHKARSRADLHRIIEAGLVAVEPEVKAHIVTLAAESAIEAYQCTYMDRFHDRFPGVGSDEVTI